ncbi:hypothetical protein C0991_010208 [Blastosporella zonata]|nr:hypothetical protein C0991_010208 [Blastosporella zonata]
MSGNRRKINLNTQINAQMEQYRMHENRQPAQPANWERQMPVGSQAALVRCQQTATGMIDEAGASRPPTYIQYGPPTVNPGHNGVPHQTHQILPIPTPTPESTDAGIKKLETNFEKLSAEFKEAKNDTQKLLLNLTKVLRESHGQQNTSNKALNVRVERVEKQITASFDCNDPESLMSRLEHIQCSVGELSERAIDPGAQEFATVVPQLDHTLIDVDPPTASILEIPVATPIPRVYEEKSTGCEILKPFPERVSSPVRPSYPDIGNEAMDLEPEHILLSRSAAIEVVRPQYTNAGNGPQTPSHPRQLQRLTTTGSSGSDRSAPSRLRSRQLKAAASASGRDGFESPKIVGDMEDLAVSPKLKQSRTSEADHEDMTTDISVVPSMVNNREPPPGSSSESNDMMVDDRDARMNSAPEEASPTQARAPHSPTFDLPPAGSVALLRRLVFANSPPFPKLPTLPSPATTPSISHFPESSPSSPVPVTPHKSLTLVISSPEHEVHVPLPTPVCVASVSVSRSPASRSPEIPDIVLGSEDESEVSCMVASRSSQMRSEDPPLSSVIPDSELEPAAHKMLKPTPPLLPDSRSHSPPLPNFDNEPYGSPPPVPLPSPLSKSTLRPTTSFKAASKAPLTISSDSPANPTLRRDNSSKSIAKMPQISRSDLLNNAPSSPPPGEPVVIKSSPICVLSRSPSPFSDFSSDSDSGSEVVRTLRNKKSMKIKRESIATRTSGGFAPTSAAASASARRIDLTQKLKAKKGESAAVTRVKKRKAPSLVEMEPPLKRARQKADEGDAVRFKREKKSIDGLDGKGKEREKDKEDQEHRAKNKVKNDSRSKEENKLRKRSPPVGCKWPVKNASGDKKFDHQLFLQCNTILADPLVPGESIVCGRPDCGQEVAQPDEFFMTAILGRHTKVESGVGRKYMWLVKWDGYPIKECTWEAEDGMSHPQSFIDDFNAAALREGKDADEDPHCTILLRSAILGGWKDPNA